MRGGAYHAPAFADAVEANKKKEKPSEPPGHATIADYDLYCCGTRRRGPLLPPFLFPASGKDSPQLAAQLEVTNSMGLLLQKTKTNIPRDFREDVDQRRYFWPRDLYSGSQYGGGFARMEEVDGGVVGRGPDTEA
ncbi:hypothetical protein B0H11DRAFT_1900953 [Mycena galericulata]|nr:hypothetical protein B0H11DRAFT_1939169 [Mycena galericulata]KAJ7448066.1 hypothetical protein B0H11DRAFT_2247972 [Mycena galericulata]KAJ7509536.1 hypothetical protein B0H11DRAFT_1900953 [Mycena galericulata]